MTRVSVVVPALDEADRIEGTLRAARRALGEATEILVVDGGSRDGTRKRAARWADVLSAARGRGAQLAAGARAASGDVLLFLHADTRLSAGAGERLWEALADPTVVAGCFRFAVDPPAGRFDRFRLLELGVNLRTRLFRSATGDQAIFVRREAFEAVGGFPELPLFEDVVLVRRLRRRGSFRPLDVLARTSRRRWEGQGFWRTVALHWALRIGFWAGLSAERLARWYEERAGGGRRGRRPDR